jgi:ammonium transporter, Amt family
MSLRHFLPLLLALGMTGVALATDPSGANTGGIGNITDPTADTPLTVEDLGAILGQTRVALNLVWVMLAMFLVMFMQAGFALVETGLTRAKNAGHTMMMNLLIYGIAVVGFLLVGFALQMGGSGGNPAFGGGQNLNCQIGLSVGEQPWGFLGCTGFGLAGNAYDVATFALFFFHLVFMDAALTIPTGALAERWRTSAFVLYGLGASTLIYPVFANWAWGGGWLSQLGKNLGLGNGYVDFAGSGVVHLTGAVMSYMGILVLGPRIGRFGRDGSSRTIPAHNMLLAILGTLILAFGWFGFNAGSTLAGSDIRFVTVAVSAMICSAGGMLAAALYTSAIRGRVDLGMVANGMLGGLVANSGSGAFLGAPASLVVGVVAGLLVVWGTEQLEQRRIDDAVGAIPVHGVCGIWGLLAVGIFADGTYGRGLNGIETPVAGILYGNWQQLIAQLIGIVANLLWVAPVSYLLFRAIDRFGGGMRVKPQAEIEGLDYHELIAPAYPKDDDHEPKPLPQSNTDLIPVER